MYSFEQDHTRTTTTTFDTSYVQPCAAGRSLQLSSAHHHHPGHGRQVHRNAAGSGSGSAAAAAAVQQPRRTTTKGSKKNAVAAAARHSSSSSRRSSTTVVATDVNNFRAMVQELTGFPPAAIFRPLPRRVHAASPFVAGTAAATAAGQGCGGGELHGRRHGSSEAINSSTAGGSSSSSPDAPAVLPVAAAQQPQFAPLGVFDDLSDLGSPEFDSWGDLSID